MLALFRIPSVWESTERQVPAEKFSQLFAIFEPEEISIVDKLMPKNQKKTNYLFS